jgi:hypothetical protein
VKIFQMFKNYLFYIVVIVLLLLNYTSAQAVSPVGQGIFVVSNCNQIVSPVANYSYCFVGSTISVWNGSSWAVIGPGSLGPPYGNSSYTQYGLLVGEGSANLQATAAGALDTLLQGQGSANPAYVAVNNCTTSLTYSTSSHAFGCNAAVGGVSSVTGTSNQILASPTTGAVVLSLIGPYTPATYTLDGVLYGNSTSGIGVAAAGTLGMILGGNTSAAPTMQQKTDKIFCGSVVAPTASQVLCDIPVTVTEVLPTSCTASQAVAVTAATGSTTFTINKIHSGSSSSAGTAVWSSSGTVGAFTCSGAITFLAGDIVQIVAPASPDATLAGIGITLSLNAGAL